MRVCIESRWILFFAGVVLFLIGAPRGVKPSSLSAGDSPSTAAGDKPSAPPPLMIEEDAPRLLDEPSRPAAPASPEKLFKPRADNSACYVCHDNFQQELLTQQHVAGDLGCVKCHGDSFAHRNDENNITPPDIMHPRETIDERCLKCHNTHNVPATKIISVFLSRMAKNRDPKSIVCSDCHGEHRLKVRTVRWDKNTGALLSGSE